MRAAERYRVLHAPRDVTARGARATAHVIEKDIDVGTVVVRRGDDKSTPLLQHIRSKGWFMEFLEWSLIAAATAADVDIMQLLLQHGASPNAADSLKRSALSHSIASKVRQPRLRSVKESRPAHATCRLRALMCAFDCC